MSFIWPNMLWLLLLLPLFIIWYVRVQRRRRQWAARYGSLGVVQGGAGARLGWRRHVPLVFFLIGLTLLIVGLARPQAVIEVPKVYGTIILAFDVSGSMAADDIKPTRLDAAKTAAQAFIERQPSTVQIGVVSFSESGLSVQPPTNDQGLVLAAIKRLQPARGTSLASGISAALTTIATATSKEPQTNFYSNRATGEPPTPTPTPTPVPQGTYSPAAIVLLSDGENNVNPNPLQAAKTAADRGVRIYTIGVGSPSGAMLKVEGFNVRSRLDEKTLQQIAQLTDGAYFNAQNAQDLREIYQNLDSQLVVRAEKTEVTSLFAGAGLLMLLLGGVFALVWLGRLP
ncbi:MAG: VWA domain-containing protein [Anaerolineae bacterium]